MRIKLLLFLAVLGACRTVSLSSMGLGESLIYRAPTPPSPAWYEHHFNDTTWEPQRASMLSQQPEALYLRQHFDLGGNAQGATDIFLTFPKQPNAKEAYVNGVILFTEPPEGSAKELGFRVPAGTLMPEGNVLALSFAANEAPQIPSIDVNFPASKEQQITYGPYLLQPTKDAITIAFETKSPCSARIQYGERVYYEPLTSILPGATKDAFPMEEGSSIASMRKMHQLQITELSEGTRYPYTVQCSEDASSSGAILASGSFTTAPSKEGTALVVLLSPGRELSSFASASAKAKELSPDLVFMLGGLLPADMGSSSWGDLFRAGYGLFLRSAIVPALSVKNGLRSNPWSTAKLFGLPDSAAGPGRAFSQEYGPAHIAVVDADKLPNPKIKSWLEEDVRLAKERGQRIVIVLSRIAFGSSAEQPDVLIDRLLEKVPSDLVIATSARGSVRGVSPKGRSYLLQGAPTAEDQFGLLEISKEKIWVRAYQADGSVHDEAKIE